MNNDIQTIVLCAIFSFLCVVLYIRWFALPQNQRKYSRKRKLLTILVAAVLGPAFWLLSNAAIRALPEGVTSWALPIAPLLFLLFPVVRSIKPSKQEEQSQKRMSYAILLGGAVLIAICLVVFWTR